MPSGKGSTMTPRCLGPRPGVYSNYPQGTLTTASLFLWPGPSCASVRGNSGAGTGLLPLLPALSQTGPAPHRHPPAHPAAYPAEGRRLCWWTWLEWKILCLDAVQREEDWSIDCWGPRHRGETGGGPRWRDAWRLLAGSGRRRWLSRDRPGPSPPSLQYRGSTGQSCSMSWLYRVDGSP